MDLKDFLEYTGIEADSIDDFKTKFDGQFVLKSNASTDPDIVSKATGKVLGSIATKAKQLAKQYNIELSGEETKDKPLEDVFALTLEKFNTSVEEKLKTAAASAVPDEAVKEWQEKYTKLESKHKDTSKLLTGLTEEYNTFKESTANQVKSIKIDTLKSNAFSGIKIKQSASDLEKAGFNALIQSNFKFDLDENGEFFVTDSKGERIKSDKKAGSFMTPDEVLLSEATKAGLIAESAHGGKPVPKPFTFGGDGNKKDIDIIPGRQVHPSVLARMNR